MQRLGRHGKQTDRRAAAGPLELLERWPLLGPDRPATTRGTGRDRCAAQPLLERADPIRSARAHRQRSLVQGSFTRRAVESYPAVVRRIVDRISDDAETADGSLEVVQDLAYVVPVAVISDMLGQAEGSSEGIYRWNAQLGQLQSSGTATSKSAVIAAGAVAELEAFFGEAIDIAVPKSDPA